MGRSGEFELDHRLQSALEMQCNELEEGCLLQNAGASGYQETSMVSETELSLAAKSANSAFPSIYIKASFGLKRAVQGTPSPCRHPGKAEAERQNKAEKTFGHWGWKGCSAGVGWGAEGTVISQGVLEKQADNKVFGKCNGIVKTTLERGGAGYAAGIQGMGKRDGKASLLQRCRWQTLTILFTLNVFQGPSVRCARTGLMPFSRCPLGELRAKQTTKSFLSCELQPTMGAVGGGQKAVQADYSRSTNTTMGWTRQLSMLPSCSQHC